MESNISVLAPRPDDAAVAHEPLYLEYRKCTTSPAIPYPDRLFRYFEVFEDGSQLSCISEGGGRFLSMDRASHIPLDSIAFTVTKDRRSRCAQLFYESASLKASILLALGDLPALYAGLSIHHLETLIWWYDRLKLHLQWLETASPNAEETAEFRLLVRDFLLDRAVLSGFTLGSGHYQHISQTYLHDVGERGIAAGLDEIDNCFALGMIPVDLSEAHLISLETHFAILAEVPSHRGLFRDACRPISLSGDREFESVPSFLFNILSQGHFDVYRYILELGDCRITAKPALPLLNGTPEITDDPLYSAIKSGLSEQAKTLLDDGVSFEGFTFTTGQRPWDGLPLHIFTPLTAAVFWNRVDLVRHLINHITVGQDEVEKAVSLALSLSSSPEDIMSVFLEGGRLAPRPIAIRAPDCSPAPLLDAVDFFRTFGIATPSASPACLDIRSAASSSTDTPWHAGRERAHTTQGLSYMDEPVPSIPRQTHVHRQKLGRNIIPTFASLCIMVREVCSREENAGWGPAVRRGFASLRHAWEYGTATIRCITNNEPPRRIIRIVQCLVVSGSLAIALHESFSIPILQEFVEDLGRWRAILVEQDLPAFDSITSALEEFIHTIDPLRVRRPCSKTPQQQRQETEDSIQFYQLVQGLVYVHFDPLPPRPPLCRLPIGCRLREAQADHKRRQQVQTLCDDTDFPLPWTDFLSTPSLHDDTPASLDLGGDDDTSWAEFVDMGLVEDGVDEDTLDLPDSTNWKDIFPLTVDLVASIGMLAVLTSVLVVRHSADRQILADVWQDRGHQRACGIVQLFIDSAQGTGKLLVQLPAPSEQPAEEAGVESVGMPIHDVRMSTPEAMDIPFSPQGVRSEPIPIAASLAGKREKCKVEGCNRTFSSISNRNKHMRHGCSVLRSAMMMEACEEKYRCRNEGCGKPLSSKWYREQHEAKQCRYKRR